MRCFHRVKTCFGMRIGITHDLIYENGEPYLERWIVWFGYTLRLHCFHKGDDDRAFHDHPWWFITLPIRSYEEQTPDRGLRKVNRFWPHFRSSKHRHIVRLLHAKPVWTLIITGRKCQEWGFWQEDHFTHHTLWPKAPSQASNRG